MWWWMQKIESACLRRSHWWSVRSGRPCHRFAVDIGVDMLQYMKKIQRFFSAGGIVGNGS